MGIASAIVTCIFVITIAAILAVLAASVVSVETLVQGMELWDKLLCCMLGHSYPTVWNEDHWKNYDKYWSETQWLKDGFRYTHLIKYCVRCHQILEDSTTPRLEHTSTYKCAVEPKEEKRPLPLYNIRDGSAACCRAVASPGGGKELPQ